MNPFRISNLKKTCYYLKKNGLRAALAAVEERLKDSRGEAAAYACHSPSEACLQKQRDTQWEEPVLFSVIVPAYETKPAYLEALLKSLLAQTYANWELILADASRPEAERCTVRQTETEQSAPSRPEAEQSAVNQREMERCAVSRPEAEQSAVNQREMERCAVSRPEAEQSAVRRAERGGGPGADSVERTAQRFRDARIRYCRLSANRGIAQNTNAALEQARGEYVCLLDHDDLLTPDALFEMASLIRKGKEQGRRLRLLYSDEDKTDETGMRFFDVYRKPDFNESLLLSNNYICHFLVLKRTLALSLRERPAYDGAQDYDLVLRAVRELAPEEIGHVPRVLYHWRCHSASTAVNPRSKQYAYEAGRRAVQDYCDAKGWQAAAEHTRHLGFYRIRYRGGILAQRPEVGAVGGRILRRKGPLGRARIAGGLYGKDGGVCFAGLPAAFSGPMHRAVLQQDAFAVDIRCIRVQPAKQALLEEYRARLRESVLRTEPAKQRDRNARARLEDRLARELSVRFCEELRSAGFRIVWDPFLKEEGSEA